MRLFIRNHISTVAMFILTFIGLGFMIETLGGIENNFKYFVFLSLFLLFIFLLIRYIRNYRFYNALSDEPKNLKEMLLHNPKSSLEEEFSRNQEVYFKMCNKKLLELENKQKEYKMFISQSIHQMKTPLSVISVVSQNNDEDENFKKVLSKVNILDYHLSQTLKFLRLNDIEKDIQIEKTNLKDIVVEVINELKDYFILNSIYPTVNIDKNVFVYTDKKQIKNIIYQITNNGIKYGEGSSKLVFDLGKDKENTILNISNEGIGINPSDIDRVFDIFYTGDNGRIYGESSGVGLYIVKKTSELLSHQIKIKSTPNKTTTFSIYF